MSAICPTYVTAAICKQYKNAMDLSAVCNVRDLSALCNGWHLHAVQKSLDLSAVCNVRDLSAVHNDRHLQAIQKCSGSVRQWWWLASANNATIFWICLLYVVVDTSISKTIPICSGFVHRVPRTPSARQHYRIPRMRALRSSAGGGVELMHNVGRVVCSGLAPHALCIPPGPVRVDQTSDVCPIYCRFFHVSPAGVAPRE